MDVLGRHRIAFNNIGVQLFGELERDLESALKRGVEEKAELQRVIHDQKKLLEERDTRVQQAAKIREQKKKIDELEIELAKALAENERLQEHSNPRTPKKGNQRTVLGNPLNKNLQNKENIPPIFNYLAPSASRTPTRNRPISPPPKSPRGLLVHSSSLNDHGIQTEPPYQKDEEVQTDLIPVNDDLKEAYYDLATRYDVLRNELNTYKGAHEELQEKYLKNKKIWEAWTKVDAERREQSRKRKRDGSIVPENGARQIIHGYTTPATSIAGQSPYSRPPTLSPNKPILTPSVFHKLPRKPKLFADLKGLGKTNASDDLGVDILATTSTKNTSTANVTVTEERVHSESEAGSDTSWPSSIAETQASPAPVHRNNNPTPKAVKDFGETTDSESESQHGIITPTARSPNRSGLVKEVSSVLPSHLDPVFKPPKIKEEKLDAEHTRSGGSVAHPVHIKTESSGISSEGFGYHLFEQESLDLDDIGYKPATPRKRHKTSDPPPEELRSSGRVGWSNGGFVIKRAPGVPDTQFPEERVIEDTEDEDEGIMFNNEESSVPAPSLPIHKELRGENQPPPSKMKISPPPFRSRPTLAPNPPSSSAPVRKGRSAIEESIVYGPSPQKPRAGRRTTSTNAIATITEDGTGGVDVGSDGDIFPHPPMILTEKERKRLEATARLSNILKSTTPRTPSLVHLRKKANISKSAPAKKSLSKSFDSVCSSEPPKRKTWIDPMRHSKGHQKKQGAQRLDISHFRVNPDVNDGRDYAFVETVRNREARKCLPGCMKACCKGLVGFVEAAGLPPPAPRGPRWRSSSPPASMDQACEKEDIALEKDFTTRFGKHRDAFRRRRSPPGFWNADFPDTQDIEKQNETAEEMRLQKVEEMRREAEKGAKGRYIYKDRSW